MAFFPEHLEQKERSQHLEEIIVPVNDDLDDTTPEDIGADMHPDIRRRKRRLARVLGPVLPIPLSDDAGILCDELASSRAIEAMERERQRNIRDSRLWKRWLAKRAARDEGNT